jgi:hypothetical protein
MVAGPAKDLRRATAVLAGLLHVAEPGQDAAAAHQDASMLDAAGAAECIGKGLDGSLPTTGHTESRREASGQVDPPIG